MLRLFQNIRPISAIFVLILGILLRIPAILYGNSELYNFDPEIMQGFFTLVNQNYVISIILGLLIIFIQSLIFNRICINHDVIYTNTYLPAYFFMLINSVYPQNLVFNPVMVINFCMLFAFVFLFQLYQGINSTKLLYYAALFMGIASLILPMFYLGVLFLIVGTIVFKNITIKDLLGILSGYVFAGMFIAGLYFLWGENYGFPTLSYRINLNFGKSIHGYAAISIMVLTALAGLIKTFLNYSKNNIKTRRITLLLIAYLVFAFILILLNMEEYRLFFPIMAASLSVQISYFILGKKQRRLKELLNYVMILAVLYSIYGNKLTMLLSN